MNQEEEIILTWLTPALFIQNFDWLIDWRLLFFFSFLMSWSNCFTVMLRAFSGTLQCSSLHIFSVLQHYCCCILKLNRFSAWPSLVYYSSYRSVPSRFDYWQNIDLKNSAVLSWALIMPLISPFFSVIFAVVPDANICRNSDQKVHVQPPLWCEKLSSLT